MRIPLRSQRRRRRFKGGGNLRYGQHEAGISCRL
ncbi:unnamed protein product [Rhodiola kirilowii]